jgi:methyl-accepting chemotaxis protein
MADDQLYNMNLLAIEAMGRMEVSFAEQRVHVRNVVIYETEHATFKNSMARLETEKAKFLEALALYEPTITDPIDRQNTDIIKTRYEEFLIHMDRLKQLGSENRHEEAQSVMDNDMVPIASEIVAAIAENNELNVTAADEAVDGNTRLFALMAMIEAAVLILTIALSLFLAFYISGQISKPLKLITDFMKKAGSTGDIILRSEELASVDRLAQNKDELGDLSNGVASFVGHVMNISNDLSIIANGDLSVSVELLSEDDVMGKGLQQMTIKLNSMFAEIKSATEQVSSGSVQIADGAQLLAQGATEQSATVQQLSASVTEVNGQTKANANLANDAKKLGESIRTNAERGNAQMEQMIKAVGEISDASTAIGKVIKIIDDIAFQTNILALNAAVEAARAGQHGKGFAVVADEVRSLAAKSAEAAKNTSELIATSIQKSEQGAAISKETAESLSQIVGGIVQSSELIAKIAESSNQQSISIGQIGEAIDQVSQVIQQNSATAEESAAASEEMSGQATMLQQLISQFKLQNMHEATHVSFNQTLQRKTAIERRGENGLALDRGLMIPVSV